MPTTRYLPFSTVPPLQWACFSYSRSKTGNFHSKPSIPSYMKN